MRSMAAVAMALALLWGCKAPAPQDPVQQQAREQGIEVLGIELMADGDVARLNYRVVDYVKAKRSLKGDARLFREGTDRPLTVMAAGRLGALRQRPTRDGRPQFMIFLNPGRVLRAGDRAVLTLGSARIAGIRVS